MTSYPQKKKKKKKKKKKNLLRRKIVENEYCPCCCRESESGLHALWNCPTAQDLWGGGFLIFQKIAFVGESFMQLVEFCLHKLNN
jgi:hypothetical protein